MPRSGTVLRPESRRLSLVGVVVLDIVYLLVVVIVFAVVTAVATGVESL